MKWRRNRKHQAQVVKSGGDTLIIADVWPTFGRDKCDRCSGYAKVRVLVPHSGLVLDFCGHHFRKHHKEFDAKGYVWLDGRSEIEKFTGTVLDISGNL